METNLALQKDNNNSFGPLLNIEEINIDENKESEKGVVPLNQFEYEFNPSAHPDPGVAEVKEGGNQENTKEDTDSDEEE